MMTSGTKSQLQRAWRQSDMLLLLVLRELHDCMRPVGSGRKLKMYVQNLRTRVHGCQHSMYSTKTAFIPWPPLHKNAGCVKRSRVLQTHVLGVLLSDA